MIREAVTEDIESILEIVGDAQQSLKSHGIDQWQNGYPNYENILSDIEKGIGFVAIRGSEIVAYAAIIINGEPEYENLDGEWLSEQDYVVIHRICVRKGHTRQGLASNLMQKAEETALQHNALSFKIDTHKDNRYMLDLLKKSDFIYCGEIHYPHGARIAFEKLLQPKILQFGNA